MIGCFLTEVVNLLLICNSDTAIDAVMNFVALAAISEIDDYYASSLTAFPQKAVLDAENLPRVRAKGDRDVKIGIGKGAFFNFYCLLFKILKITYTTFYFYFLPFQCLILSAYGSVS
jgi:hypothetical protein